MSKHGLSSTQNLAEEQEKAGAKEEAIQFYGEAAELFAAEDSTAEASKCRQKVHRGPRPNTRHTYDPHYCNYRPSSKYTLNHPICIKVEKKVPFKSFPCLLLAAFIREGEIANLAMLFASPYERIPGSQISRQSMQHLDTAESIKH